MCDLHVEIPTSCRYTALHKKYFEYLISMHFSPKPAIQPVKHSGIYFSCPPANIGAVVWAILLFVCEEGVWM